MTELFVLYGSALVLAPGALLGELAGELAGGPNDRGARGFARVLGARQLLQGVVLGLLRSGSRARSRSRLDPRGRSVGGAALDATHAATMVALALLDPGR